jgi:hypothetical protein
LSVWSSAQCLVPSAQCLVPSAQCLAQSLPCGWVVLGRYRNVVGRGVDTSYLGRTGNRIRPGTRVCVLKLQHRTLDSPWQAKNGDGQSWVVGGVEYASVPG